MFRKHVGRLLIVAAGGGCLAVVIFVVLPMTNEPAPPMTRDAIVAQVLGTDERRAETGQPEERPADEGEPEGVMPVPSPLVGVRNDGEEVAVIFPAAEPGAEVSQAAAEESYREESGLPQALSAGDVAEAKAALEGQEPEPVVTVEPNAAAGIEEEAAVAVAPPVAETPIAVEAEHAGRDTPGEREDETSLSAFPTRQAAAVEAASEPVAVAAALPVERVATGGDGRPGNALRLADRRGEFDRPVWLDSRTLLEVSHRSGRVPDDAAAGAARAEVPPRTVRAGVTVPGTLRGVMGYRLPLISRQEVPDQIVSGVLIPAHTTFVILKEGFWDLVDVTPEELERFREAAVSRKSPVPGVEPVRRSWNPLRVFRKRKAPEEIDVGQKKR